MTDDLNMLIRWSSAINLFTKVTIGIIIILLLFDIIMISAFRCCPSNRIKIRAFSSKTMIQSGSMSNNEKGNLLERLGSPTTVAAPMVQQSDLAFRLLVRNYGCELVYTQMFHAGHFSAVQVYRDGNWDGLNSPPGGKDRPLIAQFAGDDPNALVKAASWIQHEVDGVDLNLGCPQRIAKKGHYGSFLLEEKELIIKLLSTMVRELSVPVTAKIRLLPSEQETMELVKAMEDTGIGLLTVHGRTREQNKIHVGSADWSMIRKIKQSVKIPVIANGGVENYDDYLQCLKETEADAVMSSEGLLENPALFLPPSQVPWTGDVEHGLSKEFALAKRQLKFAREYLELAQIHWPKEGVASIKGHLFKLLYQILELPVNHDLRETLGAKGNHLKEYFHIVNQLNEDRYATESKASDFTNGKIISSTSWYRRHREGMENAMQRNIIEERDAMLTVKQRLLKRKAEREFELDERRNLIVGNI